MDHDGTDHVLKAIAQAGVVVTTDPQKDPERRLAEIMLKRLKKDVETPWSGYPGWRGSSCC